MAASKEQVVKPDNLLLENSMSILHLILPLLGEDRGAGTAQDLREKLIQGFDVFEKRSFESQLDTGSVSDVKYALAAFVDEKVMSSAWPHKLSWMGKPLQLEYFGDNLGGEGFFQKLAKLRQSGNRNIDALEVYYLCLQLGFEGMYRLRGLEQLQALQVDLRTQIADCRNRVPRTLSPHGVAGGTFLDKVQREVPYWVIAVTSLSLIFLSYLVFIFLLSNRADTIHEILQDDSQRIQANLDRDMSQAQLAKVPTAPLPVVETPAKIEPLSMVTAKVTVPSPQTQPKRKRKPKPKPAPPPEQKTRIPVNLNGGSY
ncbi:MAG: type IVB secretion system protein IcmH/DotU [Gammaproteobacteria bacterium]|nr:type IVB secretion system protein IcmH/DotU [Gammaproteobacteria bacterium]MBU1482075.1 type IVB secretion system protein IcmH/DotU [Gammaproteobacteria bacterium]